MRRQKLALATTAAVLLSSTAVGQYSAFQPAGPSPVYQNHKSYSDYYREQLNTFQQPQANVRDYTINRYFYQRPTLSPYLNLTRRTDPNALNNYYRYVVPEVERRSQGSSMARLTPPSTPAVTPPPNPGHLPMSNPYFNKYYNFGGGTPAYKPPPTPLPKLYP